MPNRPLRLPEFSYTGPHRYFLTVCARKRLPVLADAATGSLVVRQFLRVTSEQHFEAIAYCVMPDHFHALVQGTQADSAFTSTDVGAQAGLKTRLYGCLLSDYFPCNVAR